MAVVVSCVFIPKLRKNILLVFRINYFFFVASLRFFLMNGRSVNWEKLKVTRT
jgi:hypothetical protein